METTLTQSEIQTDFSKNILDALTSGERAALARGMDVTSDEQLAVCYLVAFSICNNTRLYFGPNINHEKLSIEVGMHPHTFSRDVSKFKIYLQGLENDPEYIKGEDLYPKIEKAYKLYENTSTQDIMEIALRAFTPEAKEKGQILRDAYDDKNRKGYAKRAKAKKDDESAISFKLTDLYTTLKVVYKNDFKKAEKATLIKVATEEGKDLADIKKIWNSLRKNE